MKSFIVTSGFAGYTHDGWNYLRINAESHKDMLIKYIHKYFDEENEPPEEPFAELDTHSLEEYIYHNMGYHIEWIEEKDIETI